MISLLKLPLVSNTELYLKNNTSSGYSYTTTSRLVLKKNYLIFKHTNYKHCYINKAQNDNPEFTSGKITVKEARDLLGVRESSSFDEILKAKNRLVMQTMDQSKISEIEAAYDVLLMNSMNQRISGEQAVPTSVRFADVKSFKIKKNNKVFNKSMEFSLPTSNLLFKNMIVFTPLATWIILQGLNAPAPPGDTLPGFQLALASAWTIYFFREFKFLGLSKAAGYTFGGLIIGALIGGGVENFIKIDENPIGGFHSPLSLVSEFALLGMWASATFAM